MVFLAGKSLNIRSYTVYIYTGLANPTHTVIQSWPTLIIAYTKTLVNNANHVLIFHLIYYYAISCYVMLCYAILCYIMLYYAYII